MEEIDFRPKTGEEISLYLAIALAMIVILFMFLNMMRFATVLDFPEAPHPYRTNALTGALIIDKAKELCQTTQEVGSCTLEVK